MMRFVFDQQLIRVVIYTFFRLLGNEKYRKESSIFRFTLIFYYVLTNLEFALKFGCPFVIREGAFCSNKVENLIVVSLVVDISSNQLRIADHALYVWPALNQKIPLALYPVHFLLLKCSPNPRLVKDINHRFE